MPAEITKGGSFLIQATNPASIFTPEDFDDETRLIAQTTREFVENELLPATERLEKLEPGLSEALMRKVGELGLLAIEVPEAYGGTELPKTSIMAVIERLIGNGFSTTYAAHQSIGTLPLVYFGNEGQKSKYLPKLITAEMIGAYALTEPQAGSDALGGSTTAELAPDGRHYILNGTKMWISNAGFANLFTVFAKVDGDKRKFSAFLVEHDSEGVSTGAEEKKMGIKSSSTRQVILQNVKVPVENLLGEVGQGAKIAFNILNTGRFKLGAACVGACKDILQISTKYAKERVQFGVPIASFGLIQEKLAEMALRIFAAESAVYRTAGLIDAAIADNTNPASRLRCIEEYAIECSIIKVLGSELLDFAADEGVQIHGGYGYSQDYVIERLYRDSRINRIYEGTNEINRLLIPNMLIKRAIKSELPLPAPTKAIDQFDQSKNTTSSDNDQLFTTEQASLNHMRLTTLRILEVALENFGDKLDQEQELIARLADIIITVYAAESAILRAQKSFATGKHADLVVSMVRVYVQQRLMEVITWGTEAISHVKDTKSDSTRMLQNFNAVSNAKVDAIALRREIAQSVLAYSGYPLGW